MKIKFFSSSIFEEEYLKRSNNDKHELCFEPAPLSVKNASTCQGHEVVSVFTNDDLSAPVLTELKKAGVRYVSIRATGYDHADLQYASNVGLKIANVPEYSPYSVAEQAIMLMLALNRKVILADSQVKQYNFTINNLIGFDLHNKNIGIIGMGRIGSTLTKILKGFGCNIFAYDNNHNLLLSEKYGVNYCTLKELFEKSDIISLHIPLNENTKYIINEKTISYMKEGVMLINTGRGGLVNTGDVIKGLESGKIGYFGMDVYEKEKGLFFYDHSNEVLQDATLLKLMSMKNVIITPHQGFLTSNALQDIANTTFYNIYNL